MTWKLLYLTTKDDFISFGESPVKNNFLRFLEQKILDSIHCSALCQCQRFLDCSLGENKIIDKTNDHAFVMTANYAFVMTSNSFRSISCKLPGTYYVFSNYPRCDSDIPNLIYISSVEQVPKNKHLTVWFIGSHFILDCLYNLMDEIICIRLMIDVNELWENYEFKKFYFRVKEKKDFELDETRSALKLMSIDFFMRKFLVKVEYYVKKEQSKTHKQFISKSFYVRDNINCVMYSLGKIDEINCLHGLPIFGACPSNFLYFCFCETMKFLNGECSSTEFCSHFGLIYYPKTSLDTDIDYQTQISLNKMNLQKYFFDPLCEICHNFRTDSSCVLMYSPHQIGFETKNFEIQMNIVLVNNIFECTCIFHVSLCNEIDDYPFVVVCTSFLTLMICHFLNNNKNYIYEFVPRSILLIFGKSFFHLQRQPLLSASTNYNFTPVVMNNFKKPLCEYLFTDFLF